MSPEEQIDQITDKESFIKFLSAFIKDRETAESLERERPEKWQWGGAGNWQNSSISSFLEAGSCYFTEGAERHKGSELTWRDLAEFLYFGKIYE